MTPKEKAQELIDNMGNIPDGGFGSIGMYEAKQCALVAVDVVIDELDAAGLYTSFWYEVKQEIEKI